MTENCDLDILDLEQFLSLRGVWSLYVAELPIIDGNHRDASHAFLLLVDNTDPYNPRVLDELHVRPVTSSVAHPNNNPTDDRLPLKAISYKNTKRNMEDIHHTKEYEDGPPQRMLYVWNLVCRSGIEINNHELAYVPQTVNCRAGAKAIIQSLGYIFRPFADKRMQGGIETDLVSQIGRNSAFTGAAPSESTLLADYKRLREELRAPSST